MGDPDVATAFPVVALRNGVVSVAWSQMPAESQMHADHARPDMSNPAAAMPLHAVGAQQVLVREGTIRR
jgi:hypothetical protein